MRDGKLYGRGAVDDKGQCLMHLAAIEAHLRVNGKLPINVKVVIEGEEEIGSPNFEAFLAREKERLACDVVVVSDTAVFAEDVPSLTTSLRGLVHWEITVHGPHERPALGLLRRHREEPAGGAGADHRCRSRTRTDASPCRASTKACASSRRTSARRSPRCRSIRRSVAHEIGVPELAGETDAAAARAHVVPPDARGQRHVRRLSRRRIEDDRPVVRAREDLPARLVPHQDPEHVKHAVTTFVQRTAPKGVRVEVEAHGDVRAVETSRDHPAVAAAARAMELGFGKPPVFIGTGGTIGPVSSFDRILHLPQVLIGVGLPDDAIHAPNEKFDLCAVLRRHRDDDVSVRRARDGAAMSFTGRFSGRAGAYVAGRPSYPDAALDVLFDGARRSERRRRRRPRRRHGHLVAAARRARRARAGDRAERRDARRCRAAAERRVDRRDGGSDRAATRRASTS